MSRAMQTISLVLLASSVCYLEALRASSTAIWFPPSPLHVARPRPLPMILNTSLIDLLSSLPTSSSHCAVKANDSINGQIYLLLLLPLQSDPLSLPSRYLEIISNYGISALRSTQIPSVLPSKVQDEIIPVLPFWVLISLGAYLLGRLGLGVMRFRDCESAYTELMGHIEKAKRDLDSRKVSWS